jgi:hypothetical protein
MASSDGAIYAFGAPAAEAPRDFRLTKPVVDIAGTPSGEGYWLVAADGGLFTFGDAGYFGSLGNLRLNKPIVGMAATPSGNGYWMVASDGGMFSFGDATFKGFHVRRRRLQGFHGLGDPQRPDRRAHAPGR